MADSKVSALTSATSVGGSDVLYLIQSNTSKKVTAGTLFANAGNVTLSGNINIGGTPQTLSSPGLISLTTPITHLTADATGGTLQLPQGTNGQLKILSLISTSGGSYAINPANIAASANIVLNSSGDSVWLLFTNNKWYVIGDKQSDVVTSVNGSTGSVTLTTSNITESGNLYYTNARVYSNVSQIGYLTAASLAGYATNNQLSAYATTAQLGVYATNAQISGFASTSDLTTANVSEVTNLYFTNTRALAALTTSNAITIESTTNNIEITANADVNIVALDDLRLTGNDVVALRNRSSSDPIDIITDFDDSAFNWEFGVDGILRTPGDVIVSGDITGWVAGTLNIKVDPESNTFIQLNDAVDSSIRTQANLEIRTNGLDPLTWVFDTNGLLTTPGDVNIEGGITLSQSSITGGFGTVNINSNPNPNAYVQLNETGDSSFGAESNVVIYSYGDTYEWKFGSDSILTLPGNLHFFGCSISAINSVSNSSGDGIGASTLQIVPDNALFNNDQYIIIDPTEPDHIHIRGGGAIDNCSAKLIFGGENSHVAVNPGANSSISIRADNNNWNFGTDGILSAPGSISSDGIISTGKSKFDKVIESYSSLVNPTGNATVDCTNSHVFNVTSINANFTANITNLNLDDGEATSITLVLNQGNTAYIANALQISGVTQTIRWQSNSEPTGNVNAIDIQSFSVLNVSGNYIVLCQLTTFG